MENKKIKLIIIGVISFICIAMWAMSGASKGFDTAMYQMLHLIPKSVALPFFKGLTVFGNTKFTIVLVLILTIIFIKSIGIHIAGIAIFDALLNQGLKHMFCRPRPEFEHLVHASGYSFPSGHTMISMMLYGFLIYLCNKYVKNTKLRTIINTVCIFLMVFVPISRIYLGVHFATDILGGVAIGLSGLLLYIEWFKKVRKE